MIEYEKYFIHIDNRKWKEENEEDKKEEEKKENKMIDEGITSLPSTYNYL